MWVGLWFLVVTSGRMGKANAGDQTWGLQSHEAAARAVWAPPNFGGAALVQSHSCS